MATFLLALILFTRFFLQRTILSDTQLKTYFNLCRGPLKSEKISKTRNHLDIAHFQEAKYRQFDYFFGYFTRRLALIGQSSVKISPKILTRLRANIKLKNERERLLDIYIWHSLLLFGVIFFTQGYLKNWQFSVASISIECLCGILFSLFLYCFSRLLGNAGWMLDGTILSTRAVVWLLAFLGETNGPEEILKKLKIESRRQGLSSTQAAESLLVNWAQDVERQEKIETERLLTFSSLYELVTLGAISGIYTFQLVF